MIKIEELRIGNLLQVAKDMPYNKHLEGEIVKVYHIEQNKNIDIVGGVFSDYTLICLGSDRLSPIPLTEEWLKRYGFENVLPNQYKLSGTSVQVFIHQDKWLYRIGNVSMKHVQTVHQLQNLHYCLHGQELTYTP